MFTGMALVSREDDCAFSHFVSSICADADTLMVMFTFYCDDSGTDPQSRIAVAGAYISTVEQWVGFKRNWEEINQREHFGVFHMAAFVARQEQFALPEWQDEDKRQRTLTALIATINLRIRWGVAVAVEKTAYDEAVPDDLRVRLGANHYTFAIRHCFGAINKWRKKYGYTKPIQYVFDRLPKGKGTLGEIHSLFNTILSGGENGLKEYGVYPDGLSFQDKACVVPLQAADIWAYENFRYARDWYFPGKLEDPRESYLALRNATVETRCHNRKTLAELVKAVRQSDEERGW